MNSAVGTQPETSPQTYLDPSSFVVFDNGGSTQDRYSILPYLGNPAAPRSERYIVLALSQDPSSSISQWGKVSAQDVKMGCPDLGKRIQWSDLPRAAQDYVCSRMEEDLAMIDDAPTITARPSIRPVM